MSDRLQLAIASFKKDSYITVEGRNKVDCFFIIQQGKVHVSREIAMESAGDEVLVPGDFFGVVSAMSSLSHIETAIALTDVTLITVRQQQYVQLIQKNPRVAIKIVKQLSTQLRFLDRTLARLTLQDGEETVEIDPSRLFDVAEYYFQQKQYGQAFYAYTKYLKHCPEGKKRAAATGQLKGLADRGKNARVDSAKGELTRTYDQGDMLFAEGEPGDEFFVLQSGSVKISKIIDNKEILLGVLKIGDIFGEMALLEGKPRAANAVANEDSSVMAVSKTNFDYLITNQPQLIAKLTTLLANRIWSSFKQLEILGIINPLGRIYGALLIQLEKSRINLESKGPHIFSSPWEDLISTLGLSEKEGYILMGELHKDKNIQIRKNRIHALSIREVVKQDEFYRKMDARKKAQQENRVRNQTDF